MTSKKSKAKKQVKFKDVIFVVSSLVTMLVFFPTTIVIFIGMLPTLVAYIVDRSIEKNKTFTIGALNFAGCFPYLLTLWTKDNSIDGAVDIIQSPKAIIVMYTLAGIGYIINWAVTIMVSSLMVQKSQMRLKRIENEKNFLEERWGEEVNGKYDLDHHGFPIQKEENMEA